MAKPSSSIFLCNVPELDLNYSHSFDFSTAVKQLNYFSSKAVKSFGNYVYLRKDNIIRVDSHVDDLQLCNYMFYVNNGKYYYCFIKDKIYLNENATELQIVTDVIQTYLFDYEIMESFIDRCHVPRWDANGFPTDNYVDEGLEFGEHREVSRETVFEYDNNYNYIITSNVPIGLVDDPFTHHGSSSGGDNSMSGGDWENGGLSANGFRFIKGYEGFAPSPYKDSAGNYTISYGITLHGCPTEYKELSSKAPISEETGARKSYEVATKYFGLKIVSRLKELGITKQCQFDSMMSLAYNCGIGVILGDNSLTRAIKNNPNDELTVRPIFEKFYISDGVSILQGLVNRRKAEADIFFNNNYSFRAIGIYNSSAVQTGTVTDNNGHGWLPSDNSNDNSNDNSSTDTVKNTYGSGFKPTTGIVSATWPRYPSGGVHTGVDIANNEGTPIYAWKSGTVRSIGAGYGLGIVIDHDDGKSTAIYGHSSKVLVQAGEHVTKGQKISLMGSTGNSTGNHLHFEIRPFKGAYGSDVNPWEGLKLGDNV